MPIIKHIAIHTTPKYTLEYILNGEKNDEMKYATGLNCSVNPETAYSEFRRNFEMFAKERFFKSEFANADKSKEKVRIHHYIQSFAPDENVTPEEAHRIGVEWAKKTFGENMQVIVSTHLDKGHIHNHFAVCPYSLDGRQWHDNMKSLNRARKISDEIALSHGLHIIEKPKHKNTQKYSEWLAKKTGTSWKQELAEKIDELILRDDVQTVSDLAEKLKEQGYEIRAGKYLSIKAPKQKNAIRSFRLGDGYSVEDLQYRILRKEQEISLAAIEGYSGAQREYAICMRQMQIAVFSKKPERVTYSDLRKSAELLNYLTENNITSPEELENRLNSAAENYQNSVSEKKELTSKLHKEGQIIEDAKVYLSLNEKMILSKEEKAEYKKVAYTQKTGISNLADLEKRVQDLDLLKGKIAALEAKSEMQKKERDHMGELYKTYLKDVKSNSFEETQQRLETKQQAEQECQEEKYKNRKER